MSNIINITMIVIGLFAILNRHNIYKLYDKIDLRYHIHASINKEYISNNPDFKTFLIKYKYWIPVFFGLILIIRGLIGLYTSTLL